MGLPLWVKPSRLGSSVGISKVDDARAELDAAVELARRHDPRVIVEASARGREVECSVLGNERRVETSLPGEIVAHGRLVRLRGQVRRGRHGAGRARRRSPTSRPIARARARRSGLRSSRGCTGLARCDFFVEPDGEVLVNEINTIPGFTETSVYAKLFEASGIPYPELCDRLVELAVERHRRARASVLRVLSSAPSRAA